MRRNFKDMDFSELKLGHNIERDQSRDYSDDEAALMLELRTKFLGKSVGGDTLQLAGMSTGKYGKAIKLILDHPNLVLISGRPVPSTADFITGESRLLGSKATIVALSELEKKGIVTANILQSKLYDQKGCYVHFNAEALRTWSELEEGSYCPDWLRDQYLALRYSLKNRAITGFWKDRLS
ncbi:MAG: hypothetical protein ACI9QC_000282 [Oceanicoccus sp.]|jgi:hypothetical protein